MATPQNLIQTIPRPLDLELYARVRGAGFIYAATQELFVASMWTTEREDLLIELCGEIDDEDTCLVERADRFVDSKIGCIGDDGSYA